MAKILWRGNTDDGNMRGEGIFEILQTEDNLKQQLRQIEVAGRTCYQSEKGVPTFESAERFIRMIMGRGHESVIEHSLLTVRFSNVSRGKSHEMVRHRLCAFSQESTRYVDESNLRFVLPPHKEMIEGHPNGMFMRKPGGNTINIQAEVDRIEDRYRELLESGWQPQDARQFLPIGVCAQIVVSANFREWRHIMRMRTSKAAHWEIRYIMCDLLEKLKEIIPVIFEDFEFAPEPDSNGYRYTV